MPVVTEKIYITGKQRSLYLTNIINQLWAGGGSSKDTYYRHNLMKHFLIHNLPEARKNAPYCNTTY